MTQVTEYCADAPIDAVITWVNGNAPSHRRARHVHLAQATAQLHENATNPHRWANSDEILYCLQSIANFAPWIRHIWIVIDGERPDLSSLSAALRGKVRFLLHRDIFDGYTHHLPTFNSLAIESLLWRIDGLSDRFLYFNDDVFLTAPLAPADVFDGDAPVLRGKWVDLRAHTTGLAAREDPAKFNHFMQVNAAGLLGFDAERLFVTAHVVHPLRRSVMAKMFNRFPDAFANNIAHRFRDLSQFLPQGLHNHACIQSGNAKMQTVSDHLHIRSGQGVNRPTSETQRLLDRVNAAGIKFLCVNDLPQLEGVVPHARTWLGQAIGGFPTARPA